MVEVKKIRVHLDRINGVPSNLRKVTFNGGDHPAALVCYEYAGRSFAGGVYMGRSIRVFDSSLFGVLVKIRKELGEWVM